MRRGARVARSLQLVVLVAVLALSAPAVWAVHDLGLLQLDGNAASTGAGVDWDDINPPVGGGPIPPLAQSGANSRVFIPQCVTQVLGSVCVPAGTDPKTVEDPSGDGTYFTGGGSKDVSDLDQWAWGGNSVPDKDEITNAYAVSFTNPTTAGPNQAGDTIVYFGMDRFATNGDATVAFWFFVNPVGLTGTSSGGFSGLHTAGVVASNGQVTTPGDIQVISDFSTGGAVPTILVRMWVGGNAGDSTRVRTDANWSPGGPLQLLFSSTNADCATVGSNDLACAIVDSAANDHTAPWRYIPKSSIGTQLFPTGSFFEGGLNVSRLLGASGTAVCVSTFMAQTRSSTSITAQLKDFALGQFNTCGSITINKVTVPSTDTTTVFPFTTTGGSELDPTFTLKGGGPPNAASTVTFVDMLPCPAATECYTVTETDPSALGYALTDLACETNGNSTTTVDKGTRTASINLAQGENVSCTFTNTKFGKIVVDKVTNPSGDSPSFAYTTTGTGYAGFNLTDAAAPNDSGPLTPGASYTVTEGAVTGWKLTNLACTSANGTSTVSKDTVTQKATISNLGAGDTVTCTFTNTLQFRVAVIVCTNELTPRFHSSNVTLGATTVASASTGTASTLCTAAANFNNLTPGSKALSVTINQNSPNTP